MKATASQNDAEFQSVKCSHECLCETTVGVGRGHYARSDGCSQQNKPRRGFKEKECESFDVRVNV